MLFLFCLSLSFLILLPIAIKCQIDLKRAIVGGISIGFVTSVILYALLQNITLSSLQVLLIEVALILFLAASLGIYRFYRDPERVSPADPHIIVSPADGKVLYVKDVASGEIPLSAKNRKVSQLQELTKTSLLNNALYLIGITMNILDVHVNRVPINGKVIYLGHIPGRFISLRKERAPLENERLTTVIDQGTFLIGIVQIASRLVRRIQSYLKEGEFVECGQRLGMIRFGSQVDLVIPHINKLKIRVKPGEEVKAGVSIIAQYDENEDT